MAATTGEDMIYQSAMEFQPGKMIVHEENPVIIKAGMTFHAHSWFTNTDVVDYFIFNTVMLTDSGAENLTNRAPETLIVR